MVVVLPDENLTMICLPPPFNEEGKSNNVSFMRNGSSVQVLIDIPENVGAVGPNTSSYFLNDLARYPDKNNLERISITLGSFEGEDEMTNRKKAEVLLNHVLWEYAITYGLDYFNFVEEQKEFSSR